MDSSRYGIEVGQRVGHLTVLKRAADSLGGSELWHCRCDCGNDTYVAYAKILARGGNKSCGCLNHNQSGCAPIEISKGERFGRLTAMKRTITKKGQRWYMQCDCGNTSIAYAYHLKSGATKSCGCVNPGRGGASKSTVREARPITSEPEYAVWIGMRCRCTYPNHRSYSDYGGRGIKVCERWLNSYEAFRADMGPRPSLQHTLDRINVDGDYEPGNCRWATRVEQANNKRPYIHMPAGLSEDELEVIRLFILAELSA